MAWSGRSKIEVVNQKVEDLKPLIHKMESAIEKLSELNTSVSRMLAVHEERLTKQEEIDNVLFTKLTNSVIKWTSIITVCCQEYAL